MRRLLVSALTAALLAGVSSSAAMDVAPPSPQPSDAAYYLPMTDGTRVAINIYFPDHKTPVGKLPVIMVQTRYGRAGSVRGPGSNDQMSFWLTAGYVVAVLDTRGSTSSFGARKVDLGAAEVADMDTLIAHLADRPWSNGQVIAYGFSYSADTADWTTTRHSPALVAAIPREVDFDLYRDLFNPGGVANDWFMTTWGDATFDMDVGRSADGKFDCRARVEDCPRLFPTLQPVDGDANFEQLRQALAGRRRWTPADYAHAEFRDDPGAGGRPLVASSTSTAVAAIRQEAKPTYYGASWMDAGTAQGALARWRSAPDVPMELWITANDHSQRTGADPLRPEDRAPRPAIKDQIASLEDFAKRAREGTSRTRLIHYYVMGADRFDTTAVWPPAEVRTQNLFFATGHALAASADKVRRVDRYDVDFSASTGGKTRWSTQFGIPPNYPDRREADRKLLTYDSAPLAQPQEIVGTPVIDLVLASATKDPAVFVYLEDVSPSGRVTYLTEGQFRAVNRRAANPAELFYDEGPSPHSFARADARPMPPGQFESVRFALLPIAAKLEAGHRVRIAIAGADAGLFHRYSEGRAESLLLAMGGASMSKVELPVR